MKSTLMTKSSPAIYMLYIMTGSFFEDVKDEWERPYLLNKKCITLNQILKCLKKICKR